MSRHVIIKNGIARIMDALEGADPLDEVARWHPDDQAQVTEAYAINEADIPAEYQFKDAWRKGARKPIETDMVAAADIQMDRIRKRRDAKLVKLDLDYMKADEAGDNATKDSIAQQKKKLRDLPETYDLSGHTSPGALKDDWPVEVS